MKLWVIAINTFREAIRNKILYSVFLFAVLLIGASAFFGAVSIGDQSQVIKDFGLFALSFFGAVLTIITGVSLLNKELKQKTIYNILSKPVTRWQFIAGKYLGLTVTVSLLVSIMGLGLFAFVGLVERQPDWLLFQGILCAILEVMVISAVVIFFSSMAVTTTLPGIFTLATYVAGHSIAYLKIFVADGGVSQAKLEGLITGLSWILPDLSLFNANASLVYGEAIPTAQAGLAVMYAVSYSLTAVTLAAMIFSKRELN